VTGRPAIFLDRDGVINENRSDHVKSWAEFIFLPGALDALRRLAQLPLPVLVVSNQAVIGRGIMTGGEVEAINRRMIAEVSAAGGRIDDVFICPHRPDEACDCRKPRPGLLLQAAERWDLDLRRCILIGDAGNDILAAHSAGCQPVLVLTGRGVAQLPALLAAGIQGLQIVSDLSAAVNGILLTHGQRPVRVPHSSP
jgi:D-glycero-D-manno-heptose 1,7-bisphosphate phosphatase